MKQGFFSIVTNERLAPATFRMVLAGETDAITAPGQFVNIALKGRFLRRPISVCDWGKDRLTIIYKVVGGGTEQMSRMVPGEQLDLLTGLGNGYDLTKSGDKPVLIGGGAGVPPLFALAKHLLAQPELPVSEILPMVGFSVFSSFSRSFKKATGFSPSEYRAQLAGEAPTPADNAGDE